MSITLTAAGDDDGRRLDRILRKALRDLPLSAIHRLLRKGTVLVDGKTASADTRIGTGQIITIPEYNHGVTRRKEEKSNQNSVKLRGEKFELPEILYEGEGLLILNKPAGLAVHGRGSLEDMVLDYLKPKLPPSLSFRPGPLHRLDKPSSGAIVFSTNLRGARFFSALMRQRKIKKSYLALVEGVIKKDEVWQDELARDQDLKKTFTNDSKGRLREGETKTALTRVSPLAGNSACLQAGSTLILAEIETGRTHQIRAQAAARGHPLLGDKKYGGKPFPGGGGFLLHAWRMECNYWAPVPCLIEAPLPDDFRRLTLMT